MRQDFLINQNRRKIINLKNIRNSQAHAYLIIGPKNMGKFAWAKKIAEFFLQSKKIANHPDLTIIKPDNAKNPKISIATIKEVKNKAQLSSNSGGNKVFIIQSAEKMTPEAQNALLKTLEEPPEKTIFILTSISEKLLLPTVESRCQKIKISSFSQKEIKKQLDKKFINNSSLISRLSLGKTGLARRFSEDENFLEETIRKYQEIIKILKNRDLISRFQKAAEFASGKSPDQYLDYLEIILRDILHLKIGLRKYLINIQSQNDLVKISNNYTTVELVRILKVIKKLKLSLSQNVNLKLAFENLMLIL